ncbi:MAG: methyl-accepting chemotaxis protein, partial [Thermoguttaceae bacterium]
LQETRRNERQGYEERLAGTERHAEVERQKIGEAEAKIQHLQETLALEKQKAQEQAAGAAEWERWQAEALRRKVDRLLVAVAAAGKGDLTQTIEVDGDEPIDELAGALTQMLADLSGLIGQVAKSASRFTDSSRVIAESSQTLALGVQTQSAGVAQMNVSVEELARSIAVVKTSAGEAHAVAKQTNALAEQGGQAVRRSIDAMEQLRHSSKQINEITQVIAEIARQTNLLSLNAAIEAARAGEHGMGFAVVADEVRKLAARTDQAANQIAKLLQDSVQQILQGVDATAQQIAAIATTTAQQAASAQEASTAIHSVALVTEQTAAGSQQMASKSEELGREAETLRGLIHGFRTE